MTPQPATPVDVAIADLLPAPKIRAAPPSKAYLGALARVIDGFPPIVLQAGTQRVIDGSARIKVARQCGLKTLRAVYAAVSDEDLHAERVRLNAGHANPLRPKDRRAAVRRLLADHPDWSNAVIADIAGFHPTTILRARERSGAAGAGPEHRRGKDGRLYPIGDQRAKHALICELLTTQPTLTLREVARRAEVSLGTVHKIHRRLQQGAPTEEPNAEPADDPETAPPTRNRIASIIAIVAGWLRRTIRRLLRPAPMREERSAASPY